MLWLYHSTMIRVLVTLISVLVYTLALRAEGKTTVICLGDSLTSGYGLPPELAYPHLVEAELKARGIEIQVINAGTAGSTTASGLARLQWLIKAHRVPKILIVALGANDGLRGQNLEQSKINLDAVITLAKAQGISVLLAGMKIPTNYGQTYSQQFEALFIDLAEQHKIPRIPFLLDQVAMKPERNLPDGIHPNREGHQIIAQTVLTHLLPLISSPQ